MSICPILGDIDFDPLIKVSLLVILRLEELMWVLYSR